MRILDDGPRDGAWLNPRERELEASLFYDLKDVGCALVDFHDEGWIWRGTNCQDAAWLISSARS